MSAAKIATLRQVEPVFVERLWGRTDLAPLYGTQEDRIGEVWFPVSGGYPLLVKFLFTSERLSVQVHPGNEYAAQVEECVGKTEMWHILAAEKGASIALGLKSDSSEDVLREAINDGSIVELLNWIPAKPGDTLFVPAGVIHAIGEGVVLCEIQQNSDVTYRLFDYGRPRELHVERGLAVAKFEPYSGERNFPVCCDHFTTEMLDLSSPVASDMQCDYLLVTIAGSGTIADQKFSAGQCWAVPSNMGPVELTGVGGTRVLRARCGG